MNEFDKYNPAVNFIYFAAVLVFTMFLMNPVMLVISFVCAVTYSVMTGRLRALRFNLACLVPMILVSAMINMLFNHAGVTTLTYINDNPLTLEAVVYGFAAAVMITAVISYFSSVNRIMTTDKLLYVFGRAIPSLSLVLSMSLRLIPRLREQMRQASAARKCMGRGRDGIAVLSSVMTYALEGSVETADSMRTRGYGLKNRTAFSLYSMTRRDVYALTWTIAMSVYVAVGAVSGAVEFLYFPAISEVPLGAYSISVYAAYFLLCAEPIIIELTEALRWKHLKSKI